LLHDGLSEQLRQIGAITAIVVMCAAGLATFALLRRIVPSSTPAVSSQHVTAPRYQSRIRPVTAPPAGSASSTAPLAAAQQQTEREIVRTQHQGTVLSRRRATAVSRYLQRMTRESRPHPTPTIIVNHHGRVVTPSRSRIVPIAHVSPPTRRPINHKGP
jgi:hypothetical protein